jgi:hypothetical protein
MKKNAIVTLMPDIDRVIMTVRDQKVILDADLAAVYGVTTKRLNEQVKRNSNRFPSDFAFQLTEKEWAKLQSPVDTSSGNRSQFATGSQKHRDPRFLPWAFTEHGAIMAANVLNSRTASQMSIFVVRAFVKLRAYLGETRDLARKLAAIESEVKSRLDVHEAAIVEVMQRIMRILDPPAPPPEPPPPEIGFHVKEDSPPYRIAKKRPRRANGKGGWS